MAEKRWVYGTKTEKWILVGRNDRDWIYGIPQKIFKRFGERKSKTIYLSPSIIGMSINWRNVSDIKFYPKGGFYLVAKKRLKKVI
jgi:hypothetical protein